MSGVPISQFVIAPHLAITNCCPDPRPLLEVPDKFRQSLARKGSARKTERVDRFFDRGRLPLHLDQHIHPWVRLEANRRAAELVLRNLAIDLPREFQSQFLDDLLE